MSKRTAAIDADLLLWKFGYRNEKNFAWDNGASSSMTDLTMALKETRDFIEDIRQTTRSEETILCFTHFNNYRYNVLPTYKHNRKDAVYPQLYRSLKDWLLMDYETMVVDPLEADDVLGIMATTYPDRFVICTIDKDLEQIPGMHFNWNHDSKVRWVTPEEGDYVFYKQCLIGDSVDGFKGIPRVGPKTAEKLLDAADPSDWQNVVLDAYMSRCLSYEYMLQQCRMARILRAGEYSWKRKEVKLWLPL